MIREALTVHGSLLWMLQWQVKRTSGISTTFIMTCLACRATNSATTKLLLGLMVFALTLLRSIYLSTILKSGQILIVIMLLSIARAS